MPPIKRTRLLITILAAFLLIGGTLLAIKFAKGYRPNLKQMQLSGSGLLSVTSYPKNAQVIIDDRLTTVTDDTLYLSPSQYQIKIVKNGFHPWTKTFPIKPELVSSADARLFPAIPSITPLTFYQIKNPSTSPDGNKLVYVQTDSPFIQDNGVYILFLSNNMILGNQIVQIADMSLHDYTKADFVWSPDSSQILAIFHDNQRIIASHLLNPRAMNQAKNLTDTTIRLPILLSAWQDQLIAVNKTNLNRLPDFMTKIATQSAINVYFSPDREKVLYTAIQNLDLPKNPEEKNIPSINPATQTKKLESGKTYVYDLKEDTNYLITEASYDPQTAQPLVASNQITPTVTPTPTPGKNKTKSITSPEIEALVRQIALLRGQTDPHSTQNLSWYSTSRHLIVSSNESVSIVEYDDNNLTPLITATLANNFTASSPDGSHLIILSNLNQKPDLYNLLSLDLK